MAKSAKNKVLTKTLPVGEIGKIVIIGCGGTGSIMAEHIARMVAGFKVRAQITLFDGDTVEAVNTARQNFYPHEVGVNKAEALAIRLAGQFGLLVGAIGRHFTKDDVLDSARAGCLYITCTDTLSSRKAMASRNPHLWLDCGNGLHHGQAVFGTTHDKEWLKKQYLKFNTPHVRDLPTIAALNPEVLTAKKEKIKAGCADLPFAKQGFAVNAMAALAGAKIAKEILVDGQVKTAAVYFNVSDGRMLPRLITQDLFAPWKDVKVSKKRKPREQGCHACIR